MIVRSTILAGIVALLAAPDAAQARTKAPQKPKGGHAALNEHITMPIPNGCVYSADVRGQKQKNSKRPTGELDVRASVSCPDATPLLTKDSIRAGRMDAVQLEGALERRATVETVVDGERCLYVPDFSYDGKRLRGVDVAYMCAVDLTRNEK